MPSVPSSQQSTRPAAAPRDQRWLAAAAAVLSLLVRLPFAARRMWDHDSVQFALGVEHYDLAAHHPHPPGYPLYIGILKLLAACGIDALHGMVAMSILGSSLGACFLVLLTDRLTSEGFSPPLPGDREGDGRGGRGVRSPAFAAALYVFNPLLWFYGELPLLYAVEGGITVLLAWAALRMEDGRRPFFLACILFALAGGLRQSTLVLLFPLFLYGLWRTWRRGRLTAGLLVGGGLAGAAIVLAWFIPLCLAAGGYGAYRRISSEHFQTLLPQTSILYGAGWGALAHNLEVLIKWGLQGIVAGAVALAVLWLATPGAVLPGLRLLGVRLPFLLLWAAPPMLFFALFHITKAGYTLIHLPALLAALAVAAAPALSTGRGRTLLATSLAVAAGAGLFLFGSDRRPQQPRAWAVVRHEFNRGSLAEFESALDGLLASFRHDPAGETALATVELSGTGASGAEGFLYSWHRHLQWYLPQYQVAFLVPEQGFAEVVQGHRPFRRERSPVHLAEGTRRIVFVLSALPGSRLPLPPGRVERFGKELWTVTVPLRGDLAVGPLVLTTKQGLEDTTMRAGARP